MELIGGVNGSQMGWKEEEEKIDGDGRHLLRRFFFCEVGAASPPSTCGAFRCSTSERRLTDTHCSGRFSYCSAFLYRWCFFIFIFFIFYWCQFVASHFSWARGGGNPAEKEKNLKP